MEFNLGSSQPWEEQKQKADAEKTLQQLFSLLSPWVQTSPSCHTASFLPVLAPDRSAGIVQPLCGEGDLFAGRRLSTSIRVIAH